MDPEVVITILKVAAVFIGLSFIVFWVGLVWWVSRDVITRTNDKIILAVAVAFASIFGPVGVLLYLMVRPRQTIKESYQEMLETEINRKLASMDMMYCPFCGAHLEQDAEMGKAVHPDQLAIAEIQEEMLQSEAAATAAKMKVVESVAPAIESDRPRATRSKQTKAARVSIGSRAGRWWSVIKPRRSWLAIIPWMGIKTVAVKMVAGVEWLVMSVVGGVKRAVQFMTTPVVDSGRGAKPRRSPSVPEARVVRPATREVEDKKVEVAKEEEVVGRTVAKTPVRSVASTADGRVAKSRRTAEAATEVESQAASKDREATESEEAKKRAEARATSRKALKKGKPVVVKGGKKRVRK